MRKLLSMNPKEVDHPGLVPAARLEAAPYLLGRRSRGDRPTGTTCRARCRDGSMAVSVLRRYVVTSIFRSASEFNLSIVLQRLDIT